MIFFPAVLRRWQSLQPTCTFGGFILDSYMVDLWINAIRGIGNSYVHCANELAIDVSDTKVYVSRWQGNRFMH